jgi:hypothetical protein
MSVTTAPGGATPMDNVGVAIAALQSAQLQCRARPALVVELERVLGRLGDVRRALLVAGVPQQHGVSIFGGASGVRAQCLCSWTSPYHVARRDEDRAQAWARAERAGATHLAAIEEHRGDR